MLFKKKYVGLFFFFKQKTAYEIYQCDWSSDVCSSDLAGHATYSVIKMTRQYCKSWKSHRLDVKLMSGERLAKFQTTV